MIHGWLISDRKSQRPNWYIYCTILKQQKIIKMLLNNLKVVKSNLFIFLYFSVLSIITFPTHDSTGTPNSDITSFLSLIKSSQIFDPVRTNKIALGDFDDDGDLDAVFSNMGENNSTLWLNDGDGYFTDSGQRLTKWAHGVGVGDLDGDNDLDLFIACSSQSHKSKVYLNNGSARFIDSGQDLNDLNLYGNAVHLLDIDTDNDLDAVVVYYQHYDKVYLNNGKGVFTESSIIIPEHSTFADIDSDGDVDIFIKEYGIGYKTMLNDGHGIFSEYWQAAADNVINGDVAIEDLDGDSDVDAFICNGDNSGNNYPTTIWMNDGTGSFSDSGQEIGVTYFGKVGLGDLDGNSSIDAFVSNFGHPNQVWINNGKGLFTDSGLRLKGSINDNTSHVSLNDLDNDGDLDIFVANFVDGQNEVWFNRLSPLHVQALKIATWNLLDFSSSNSSDRVEKFRMVLEEINPDILIVQEMVSSTAVNLFLNEVLNHSKRLYKKAVFLDGPDTDNAAFYKKTNLKLISIRRIPTSFRDINEYRFKTKKGPGKGADFRIYAANFKEGSSASAKQQRTDEAQVLRTYLDGLPSNTPFLLCGSLNFYASDEDGFIILTSDTENGGCGLIDPLGASGKWHDNKNFSRHHTQSTRKKPFGNGASGGLDDRFDMILISSGFEDNEKLSYIRNSCLIFGNDGKHFNKSVNKPKNKLITKTIADALYKASDHLPVVVKLFPTLR